MTHVKIMTFNTGNDLMSPSELVSTISRTEASVVGLQELSAVNATALAGALVEQYPYRILRGEHVHGKGLLSRYPIMEHEHYMLASDRPYIEARLEIGRRAVDVVVAHLPPPDVRRLEVTSARATQDVRLLLDRLRRMGPALVLGDFNFIGRDRRHRLLRGGGLLDTFQTVGHGRGLTYPTRYQYAPIPLLPLVRIDYIWVTHHFVPVASQVGEKSGSDHLPVISGVRLLD